MRQLRNILLLIACLALATALAAAQDDDSQPSLGDVARKARLQKQKTAAAQGQDQVQDQTQDQAKDQIKDQTKDQAKDPSAKNASAGSSSAKDTAASNKSADKDASSKDAPAKPILAKGSKKVVTNDELPEHVGPTSTLPQHPRLDPTPDQPAPTDYGDGKVPPQYWKNQIQALKESISELESQIQDVTDSIRYAGSNCVSTCQQWNMEQQQKEQQVKMMTAQLEQQQKTLEAMQEAARKQGYSSAVYDP